MARLVVIGSLNCDVTVRMSRLPRAEETVLGSGGALSMGGKGQNQAMAGRRFGAVVAMVGVVGDDVMGAMARTNLSDAGIDTSNLLMAPGEATGCAAVLISEDGSNMIAVAPGANQSLSVEQVVGVADVIADAAVVLTQLEIPFASIRRALEIARAAGVVTVLNPAPADRRALDLLDLVDVVTPNEPELAQLSGMEPAGSEDRLRDAMQVLIDRGARQVVATLGGDGCVAWDGINYIRLPAFAVEVIDVNGAGDVFNGVLATCLAERMSMESAMRHASAAAAISVTRHTSAGAPDRSSVVKLMANA